ncbi:MULTISPECIES: FadR/GntR family transcriptional regulator [unclassified Rothia (in: high G+C Gram-positive bacteria)]|uniref:FadR/GntR family transcriptional regulator n=1 Tax=Rothia TaxID=32207 RepID=UPI0008A217A2|nr:MULTISPECIES: FCD domain-containing protein [unclassified Rothia (in: high G+C Gram-positive bacteria)]OFL21590.1 GntR family transcriptional regulator [Rothia sp. HMSC069C03]OFQ62022.1 GntR family transcriptional regulator [Rothia sp. HMSC061E04]
MAIHRKILRWLENELFEGNIQLGQDLPSDSEIARAIGVSRSRTREALRTLEDMDLVQLYNGRGKEMLVHLSDEPAAAASAALRLHMSSSRYPTRDLVQTRILLESWAIARIDPKTASFAEMDEVLEQMEDFDLSIRDFLELLLTFHHQVMRCAGNELLVGLLASVRQPSFESMLSLVGRMPLWSSAVERLRAESRAIAEALKAGDAATARAMVIGQLRGMYSDAGIDLEQEATSANGLPGEPIASEFAPVDVDEFAADDFDDLMQDDASFADVGALPAAEAPVAASAEPTQVPAPVSAAASAQSADVEYEQSESEAAHVEIVYIEETASEIPSAPTDTSAETTTGADVSASDRVERSIPAVAQPASAAAHAAPAQPAAHSVSPDVPLSFGTPRRSTPVAQTAPAASAAPVSGVQAPASQTLASQPLSSQTLSSQTPSGQLPSVPDAYAQEEAESPAKVLRASTAAPRRRSGQIISPVRATIIKPVDRSKVLTAPARTARPAAVVTAAAPAESESAEKVLRAPARQEAPAAEPAEPTRLEAAATIHDTYEKLPHDEPVQERGGIFSKMKRFFGVDVYEPEHDEAQESAEKKQVLKAETKPESQPEPQPVIDEEALARAEAERAERLKALHAAVEEEAAEESAIEEVSVEEPVEEPAEASDPAQESVEAASPAEESTPDAAVASSGSVLSHGGAKGSKKSKKKRR